MLYLLIRKKFSEITMNRNTIRNLLIAIILFSGISVGIKKFNLLEYDTEIKKSHILKTD